MKLMVIPVGRSLVFSGCIVQDIFSLVIFPDPQGIGEMPSSPDPRSPIFFRNPLRIATLLRLVKAIVAIESAGPPFEATIIGTGKARA